MLGRETDLLAINTSTGKIYNFGFSAGIKEIEKYITKVLKDDIEKYAIVSGIILHHCVPFWGDKNVVNVGRHFASD